MLKQLCIIGLLLVVTFVVSGQASIRTAATSDGKTLSEARVMVQALEGASGMTVGTTNEFQVDHAVSWTSLIDNFEDPIQSYGNPQSRFLTAVLQFDTSRQGTDVYALVKPLEDMSKIDADLRRPPLCRFTVGTFAFVGVIETISQKYSTFLSDGTRVKAEVQLKMKSAQGAQGSPR